MYRGKNHNLKMLQVHVPTDMLQHMSPRVSWYFYTCATPIWGVFSRRDVSHEVQRDELCDMSRGQNVPAIRPCHMSPQCALHMFLSMQHVAVLCPCNMTPCVFPPLLFNGKKKQNKTNKPTAIMTPLKRVPALLSYLTNSEGHRAGLKVAPALSTKISIV